MTKGEIALRIVDKLVKASYNEVVVEDGVLYVQVRHGYLHSRLRGSMLCRITDLNLL